MARTDKELLILGLLEQQDMYGYQMIEMLERRSNHMFTLKAGTLYPILHELERQGLVSSYEGQPDAGKPRRYYRLTREGRHALTRQKAQWKAYAQAVNQVLGEPEGGAGYA